MDKKIYIGACYYPEQWPEERWEKDADIMAEAGINVVRLADLCWATMEPEDGVFDFSIFDRVLDILHKRGIQAVMCTPTMVPPMWMWKKHPDIFITADNRVSNDIRSRYCPNNPQYMEYTKRIAGKMAENFKNHPAVIAWQIDNEFNGSPCICEYCAAAFRDWLKEKYGTLDNLNKEWGTVFWSQVYTDWEQVAPPSKKEMIMSVSQKVDFLRFTSDSTVRFQKLQADILRTVCPTHKLTHNGMGLFDRIDYFSLAGELDFFSLDSYPDVDSDPLLLCMTHDLTRGVKQKEFWVMEQKNGYFNYAPYNMAMEPGLVRLWSYRDIARGADGVVYFRWRSGRFGAEQHPQGLLRHDGSKRRTFFEVKSLAEEIKALGPSLPESKVMAEVGMLWSYDQIWAFETHVQNSKFSYRDHFKEYYDALAGLGITADLINPMSELSEYKLVVAPALFLLNETIAERLKTYVKNGGTLILTARTGVRSWSNVTVDTPWPGLLRGVAGATVTEFDSLPEYACNKVLYKEKSYEVKTFLEILECESAKTVAVYDGKFYKGQAAVTENRYGDGKVLYCGVMGSKELLTDLLKDELNTLNVNLHGWPKGIEVTRRKAENKVYTFILNSNFEDTSVILDREYKHAVTGEKLSGEVEIKKLDAWVLI